MSLFDSAFGTDSSVVVPGTTPAQGSVTLGKLIIGFVAASLGFVGYKIVTDVPASQSGPTSAKLTRNEINAAYRRR
jgi:hypothetical protein